MALQLDNRAWGLFWAGGGLQRCRELLAEQVMTPRPAPLWCP
ncbi:hypothetical protein SynWH8101_1076 [Synechococcus sp. WH 8101]|nr:hypothetical protein [Synechococcus sp. WH 8101]QBE68664.1 hypothetical protein SynWH8101_1076 [Synechococcus sp. WH 8101]QNI44884.1 hypothetical protein SynRCC2555_01098 [Synechococcus sp. WH 8101]